MSDDGSGFAVKRAVRRLGASDLDWGDPAPRVAHLVVEDWDGQPAEGFARDRWGADWRDPAPGDPRFLRFWRRGAESLVETRAKAIDNRSGFMWLTLCASAADAERFGYSG